MEGNTMTCFHSAKMVFIRAKIHINLKKRRYDTPTHTPAWAHRIQTTSLADQQMQKKKTHTDEQANERTKTTINMSVATGMETFKNLKMFPYVHRLYASWITESNPLFFLRLSLSFTGISHNVVAVPFLHSHAHTSLLRAPALELCCRVRPSNCANTLKERTQKICKQNGEWGKWTTSKRNERKCVLLLHSMAFCAQQAKEFCSTSKVKKYKLWIQNTELKSLQQKSYIMQNSNE